MANSVKTGKSRFCQAPLIQTFVDLGTKPLCQHHAKSEELNRMEPFYPLHAYICENCFLVQLEEFVARSAVFNDPYFSLSSYSWLQHAKRYTDQMVEQFPINSESLVAELAGNDRYLLQYFTEKGIPVLGIETASNVAQPSLGSRISDLSNIKLWKILFKNASADSAGQR